MSKVRFKGKDRVKFSKFSDRNVDLGTYVLLGKIKVTIICDHAQNRQH